MLLLTWNTGDGSEFHSLALRIMRDEYYELNEYKDNKLTSLVNFWKFWKRAYFRIIVKGNKGTKSEQYPFVYPLLLYVL